MLAAYETSPSWQSGGGGGFAPTISYYPSSLPRPTIYSTLQTSGASLLPAATADPTGSTTVAPAASQVLGSLQTAVSSINWQTLFTWGAIAVGVWVLLKVLGKVLK